MCRHYRPLCLYACMRQETGTNQNHRASHPSSRTRTKPNHRASRGASSRVRAQTNHWAGHPSRRVRTKTNYRASRRASSRALAKRTTEGAIAAGGHAPKRTIERAVVEAAGQNRPVTHRWPAFVRAARVLSLPLAMFLPVAPSLLIRYCSWLVLCDVIWHVGLCDEAFI
jgi:hypothetical protein